jgi:hypothetical protein
MFNFPTKSKNVNKEETKKIFLKKIFNSENQKKVVTKAANQSAEDQRILVTKYRRELINT